MLLLLLLLLLIIIIIIRDNFRKDQMKDIVAEKTKEKMAREKDRWTIPEYLRRTRATMYVTVRRVRESLLPWKSNKYYLLVCVCVRACRYLGVCMRISACSLANPACNAYVPYCDVICGPSISTTFFNIISYTVCFSKKKVIERKICVLIFSITFV
jgi:hypothetical protein